MTKGTTTILDELLSDPLVQLVMARDSVRPENLRSMLERDRARAADAGVLPPAHVIAACGSRSLCC
jgi:alkylation response protein AidB-like acyl-CoA dehydrogenase